MVLIVYDLPETLLPSLSLKSDQQPAVTTPDAATRTPTPASADEDEIPNATSCALCRVTSETVVEQRIHYKSDLHRFNLKLKVRGEAAVSENQFEQMLEGIVVS
jgi:hypothetical protein